MPVLYSSISKIPIGPFQKIYFEAFNILEDSDNVSFPISTPIWFSWKSSTFIFDRILLSMDSVTPKSVGNTILFPYFESIKNLAFATKDSSKIELPIS